MLWIAHSVFVVLWLLWYGTGWCYRLLWDFLTTKIHPISQILVNPHTANMSVTLTNLSMNPSKLHIATDTVLINSLCSCLWDSLHSSHTDIWRMLLITFKYTLFELSPSATSHHGICALCHIIWLIARHTHTHTYIYIYLKHDSERLDYINQNTLY